MLQARCPCADQSLTHGLLRWPFGGAALSFGRSEVAVRLNSVESGHAEDDLRALLGSATLPQALVVPKAGACNGRTAMQRSTEHLPSASFTGTAFRASRARPAFACASVGGGRGARALPV